MPDGRFEGYRHSNEGSWTLEEDILKIFGVSGRLTWMFLRDDENTAVRLVGEYQPDSNYKVRQELRAFVPILPNQTTVPKDNAEDQIDDENIRLVIWDLDDTFWQGTLSEGQISKIAANIHIIKTLTDRGIINSVCSKNHFDVAREKLEEFEVWSYIVFPKIDFKPKGALIQDIIKCSQLRAKSVLFVDDNSLNLNEALHYNSGLQVALPSFLPSLLDDPRLKGKPDPDHIRLSRYKVLEEKTAGRNNSNGDNVEFLTQSDIKISFHYDVIENFDRVHDLVNRTNQLNFTKQRWPEDRAKAQALYSTELQQNFHSQSGYVKVSDKYGDYGICGFYLVNAGVAKHFLFSCRSMNMGVEQFVWNKINRPHIAISGEVISDIGTSVDWITIVADADLQTNVHATSSAIDRKICIRGACDLEMVAHYLHGQGKIIQEYPYPFRGWSIISTARIPIAAPEAMRPENKLMLEKLPGMPSNRFKNSISDLSADVYVLSFSQEFSSSLYRSRSTGLMFPMSFEPLRDKNMSKISYEELVCLDDGLRVTQEQWQFFLDEFQKEDDPTQDIFKSDVAKIFDLLSDKTVIIAMMNTKFGSNKWLLDRFKETNETVRSLALAWNQHARRPISIIEFDEILQDDSDLTEERGGAHFSRDTYRKVAAAICTLMPDPASAPSEAKFP